MKKAILIVLVLAAVAGGSAFESRYSDDMQDHIDTVNRDLEMARVQSSLSTGLLGSLQAMTSQTEVAGEIMDTHEHVHTIRDEILANKIKKAVEEGVTVGGAIQSVITAWPDSI